MMIREDYLDQIRWIFRKLSKGGVGGVISDPKNYVALFRWRENATGTDFPDKSATFFSENRVGGGGGQRPFGSLRKFIEFGTGSHPLWTLVFWTLVFRTPSVSGSIPPSSKLHIGNQPSARDWLFSLSARQSQTEKTIWSTEQMGRTSDWNVWKEIADKTHDKKSQLDEQDDDDNSSAIQQWWTWSNDYLATVLGRWINIPLIIISLYLTT